MRAFERFKAWCRRANGLDKVHSDNHHSNNNNSSKSIGGEHSRHSNTNSANSNSSSRGKRRRNSQPHPHQQVPPSSTGGGNSHSGSGRRGEQCEQQQQLPSGAANLQGGGQEDAAALQIKARQAKHQQRNPHPKKQSSMSRTPIDTKDFFTEYGESNRYVIREIIGKGSYGVVCSAVDTRTGEKVAIKKITNVFDHVSDATRILREIKLLRLLRHNDIVEIKHIMLPPSPREFKDIYVVFELMETDLHQVIKANDDLTPEHHQFFLYQMLRGLKYIHSAKVFHRDLKPKNILANSDCKLKICDFGLARPQFSDMPTTIYWTDYVATRWYRAPELCGSFFAKYSPAIDIWSVGCIFAEVLLGKPLFPGRNVVHQLEIITDLLGTPSPDVIAKVKNEKARRFLSSMRRKPGVPFEQFFPKADKGALRLLKRMLAFDPAERPTSEAALADPYFHGLASLAREPTCGQISKLAFDFERRKLMVDEVRDLIYREILEYHPQMKADYLAGRAQPRVFPSPIENLKRQMAHLETGMPLPRGASRLGQAVSLPREQVDSFQADASKYSRQKEEKDGTRAVDHLGSSVRNMSMGDRAAYHSYKHSQTHASIRSNSFHAQ